MATYTELRDLFSNDVLLNKVDIAILIAANDILAGTPTENDQKWVASVFGSPRFAAERAYMALLAENNTATVAQITGSTDAAIQAKVDAIVPSLVVAFNAV